MTAIPRVATTASYRNPHATLPIPLLTFLVVKNTSDDQARENIAVNAARDDLDVLASSPAHDGVAVIVGGGPSAADHLATIRLLQERGATVFGGNAASGFLGRFDIPVDYQVVGDAKPETASLVDGWAARRLIASQVDPSTLDRAIELGPTTLWHLLLEGGIEDQIPKRPGKKGNYVIVTGSSTVGDFMVRLAFAMGYRELHIFGFDSCHRDGKSHAYAQPMNDSMPCTAVEWNGKSYFASLAMKAQAEKFQVTARRLKAQGCTLHLYGDGLLQAMYRTDPSELSEKDAYRLIWQFDTYRNMAPGETLVETFLEVAKPAPGSTVIDFGCGTGRASLALQKAGLHPLLVDFADNCRDQEAIMLDFMECDLTEPIPLRGDYGFCTDVMEHIAPQKVEPVLRNILSSVNNSTFFQISTIPDKMGVLIGRPLHLTVRSHDWWRAWLEEAGGKIEWERKDEIASLFLVSKPT